MARSIEGKRAIFLRDVSRQLWGIRSDLYLPPTDPTFVHGPRGGVYLAVGPWERTVTDDPRWDKNLLTVIDRSSSVRYLRPGSRLYRKAVERG